ncbi:type IV toxin-antitoxin system AbiEi family antitoxin [Geothrix mesophila]|uniref:type IV toxin-antitoxin system AbiEi family antitoxin n=1 Tax=Geothrix mesophila TaxID=2922723 RepID=UPI001FAC5347
MARGQREIVYWVVVKKTVDRHAALVAFNELATHAGQDRLATEGGGLLITNQLSEELADRCRKMRLQFLDAAGNAYLNQDGLFVLIQGKRLQDGMREKPARAFDRTGLRVVFTLLVDPELLNAPYREIAKAAGVALGTVGRILTDLRMQGLIVEQKDGQRRWVDRDRAMKTWALNYPLRLRPKLNPRRYQANNDTWWHQADPAAFGGYWGGEVAAARRKGNLAPTTATLYLPENRNPFLTAHRLRADDQGPIEILDVFWDLPEGPRQVRGLAPDLLIYADLAGMGDPRTHEEAERIYDDLLAGA